MADKRYSEIGDVVFLEDVERMGRIGDVLADLPVSDITVTLGANYYPEWWPEYLRPPDSCPKCGGEIFNLVAECTVIHAVGPSEYSPVLACDSCDWRRRRPSVEP